MPALHRRIRNSLTKLDAFPKVEASYQTRTSSGGLLTLVLSGFLVILTMSEFADYRRIEQKYEFLVDQTAGSSAQSSKLQVNVDMTLAMKCDYVTVDVTDVGGSSLHVKDALRMEPAEFTVGKAHQLGTGSHNPLNVHRLIKDAQRADPESDQIVDLKDKTAPDPGNGSGCRVQGSFNVNKVMGNLHLTALGHGYGGRHVPHDAINFTHRVDKMSFGVNYPGLVNPLDHSFEVATENFQQFQYFISIVPTIYLDYAENLLLTSQYAVTDYRRNVDVQSGPSLPGIFFKYDLEAISVRITETRKTFMQFLVRLCGIVGGLFAAAGMLHQFTGSLVRKTKEAMGDKPKIALDGGSLFK